MLLMGSVLCCRCMTDAISYGLARLLMWGHTGQSSSLRAQLSIGVSVWAASLGARYLGHLLSGRPGWSLRFGDVILLTADCLAGVLMSRG